MIFADTQTKSIRIQAYSGDYLKLNDGIHTFSWFYQPTRLVHYKKIASTILVEW